MTDEVVACGSCSACCRRERIPLVAGDRLEDYDQAKPIPATALQALRRLPIAFLGYELPHKRDGSCVYLEAGRCSIYDKRPKVCREFSCIGFVRKLRGELPRVEIRRALRGDGTIDREIWRAGVQRGG